MTTTEITFDKLVYIDRLKSAGIAEQQARAHAEALDQALRDTVATKQDVFAVKQDIAAVKQELKDDIRDLRTEMRTEIVRLDTKIDKLDAKIDKLDTKIESTVALAVRDIKIWLGGIIIVAFGALASIKFFG